MDIARAPAPAPGLGGRGSTFLASVPPVPASTRAAAYSPAPQPGSAETSRVPERLRQRPAAPPPIVTFADVDPAPPPLRRTRPAAQGFEPLAAQAPDVDQRSASPDGAAEGTQGMGAGAPVEEPVAAGEPERRPPLPSRRDPAAGRQPCRLGRHVVRQMRRAHAES